MLAPLVSGSTYRRGVHLLLGGVLLLPYVLLGVAFTQLFQSQTPRGLSLLLLALTVLIAGTPAFLGATRTLEIVAARALLAVDLPDPPARPPDLEARLRSALWFAVHLITGGAVAFAMLAALPVALAFIAAQVGIGTEVLAGLQLGPLDEDDPWWSLLGLAILVALAYAVAGLGRLAVLMAPVLLGPSAAERIAALEAEADRLAERNRLARELHDSIGHALTVTTLQAAAAGEMLDTDPEFVRRALRAVEETGRAAMADLDHVLGLLRADEPRDARPRRTLADLDRQAGPPGRGGGGGTGGGAGRVAGVSGGVAAPGRRPGQAPGPARGGGPPHRAGGGGTAADGRRTVQRGDRRPAGGRGGDRQDPRRQRVGEARRPGPDPGRDRRVRVRVRHPRRLTPRRLTPRRLTPAASPPRGGADSRGAGRPGAA